MRQVTFPSSHEKFPAPSFLVSVRLVECPTSRAANADARDVSTLSSVPTIHPRQVAMHDCQAEISLEKINAHARPGFGEVRWIDEEIFQHWGVAAMREVFEIPGVAVANIE